MKVLALNSSPRGKGESKTGLMLDALVKGMRGAGAEVEVVQLRGKTIRNCIGCFTCWTKTPGQCIHKDDMSRELYPKWLEAELAVYASPLYYFTVNATMKTFMERTLPMLEPFFEQAEGVTRHPLRREPPKAVVLSVAGFPEMSVFDQLSSWARIIFKDSLLAEIYRPAAEILTVPAFRGKARDILAAVEKAGHELTTDRRVSPANMDRIAQDIVDDGNHLALLAGLMWKTCIAEGVSPKEFEERRMIPRPDSIETFMLVLPMGFNPREAGNTKAVLQFNFTGKVDGACHFSIADGRIQACYGVADKPDLTIKTPFGLWMDILTGKADGGQTFAEQKYTATGDLALLLRMNELFGK
jgi:multimeric flavodoxin WrbA